jgi:molecular chaperone GrpE
MGKDEEGMEEDSSGKAQSTDSAGQEEPLDSEENSVENLKRERDENYDLLLRKQAEFDNFRKRVTKEKEELRLSAQAAVIEKVLNIVDAFEKGLSSLEQESEESALETYRQGYELMFEEFKSVLKKFNVTEIPGSGTCFDPNVHEAVVREVTTEYEEGEILEEYRKGYMIKDRLLRPAQVKVAVQPDKLAVGEEESGDPQE